MGAVIAGAYLYVHGYHTGGVWLIVIGIVLS